MEIKKAIFKSSSSNYKQCPSDKLPDLALIGRSNVGKSSLVNMLLGHKGLAKISNKPGKTQLINHFLINNDYYLVDLPGYGWARSSKTQRAQWKKMVSDYLLHRQELRCVFVLIDGRLPPQTIDLDFIRWLGENKVSFAVIITKADKVSKQQIQFHIGMLQEKLVADWEVLPQLLITSSKNKTGRQEVLNFIEMMLDNTQSE
jgi:GTP-binding protein